MPHIDIVSQALQRKDRGLSSDVAVCNVGLDAEDASLAFRHRAWRWCAVQVLVTCYCKPAATVCYSYMMDKLRISSMGSRW